MFLDFFKQRNKTLPPLLLFDYDGVIADSYEVYFFEFTRACAELGFDHLNSREAFLKLFDGNLIRQLIRAGFPLWKLKSLAEMFAPRIALANQQIEPFAGMPEMLARLGEKHPLYIITANDSATVQAFVDRYNLHQVRGVIGSDEETSKVKKIRTVRRRFKQHRAYYMGDTRGDMLEARRAGAVPVGVGWGWHGAERLRTAGPAHIVETQQDLLELFSNQGQQ